MKTKPVSRQPVTYRTICRNE